MSPALTSDAQQASFCTFELDGLHFGIHVLRVQEVLRHQEMTPVPCAPRALSGLINLRGQIITAIDLRRRLDLPERPRERLPMNVVVRTDDGAVSLLVDEIGDVITAHGTLDPPPATIAPNVRDLLMGVHRLEGALLHVLDADRAVAVVD